MGAGAHGVHHALEDAWPVDAGEPVDQVTALEQDGPRGARRLRVLVVDDPSAGLGRQRGALGHRSPPPGRS
jgi:hypothetical protein